MTKKISFLLAVYAVFTKPLQAHEGHSHTPAGHGETAVHYLTSSYHLAEFAFVAMLVLALGWFVILSIQGRAARNSSSSKDVGLPT